ncbi:MAG: two-component system, HptB-dependent secretion and biofilm response regulator [Pseudomonadota bacterium]|nr:two-component system, HptB-dependent secretion and biofilm response regulator [Pseudomonadota bacterium]MDQ5907635.1 two-component system, HptB-dependent secretion and biofilm response regulator [Pseudomonadota bacterium]MDQ5917732.1 two-component system, HptB-dependent secretion and biofilm response regulator [Pseudomonadota bacterium]MDQ5959203.1 two-component system, HptB-dependent secretion and biofilm response regulator [Pseudomonadota bacterium]
MSPTMDELPKLRVLTVDDNRTNLQILQVFLKKLGHEAIPAENGEVAVAKYHEHKPDLILMDIMMPVMDGLEATRQIRAQPSERWVPIIFLSALDRDENLVGGLEAGGDDYLSKPINFVVLEAKMRSMQRTLMLQQSVGESLQRLRTISDNVLDAIITIDTDATILSCNRAVEVLFGWTPDELVGQNVKVLCPEPYRTEHDSYVREYVTGGPPRIIGTTREVPAQRRDGSTFPAELGVSEVRLERKRMFIGVLRDISERKRAENQLKENADKLQHYYESSEAESHLAHTLIERQLMRPELDDPLVQYWLTPAQNFSGDVLAATRSASGRLYALLADATGHGLTAAISTVPVLTLFYRMAPEDTPLATMIAEINQQLRESMPVGRFVGATMVCLDTAKREGEIWIGGMPNVVLLDNSGSILREFASQDLPLGIVDSKEINIAPATFSWQEFSQLMLCSDGVLEAENQAGEQFGQQRLLAAIAGIPTGNRRDTIQSSLLEHLGSGTAQDDISLLLLSCPAT